MLAKVTRKSIYLNDHLDEEIRGCKLPSRLQVLRYFFYRVHDLSESTRSSSIAVANSVFMFWQKARIPTRKDCHVAKKILDLYHEWRCLQKNSKRRTDTQISKEHAFTDTFHDLFDVALENALNMITIEEDRQFLILQRQKGRPGSMASVDTKLHKKEERRCDRMIKESERKERCEANKTQGLKSTSGANFFSEEEISHSSDKPSTSTGIAQCMQPVVDSQPKRSRGTKNVLTPKLVATLDTAKLSVRKGTAVVTATASAFSVDVAGTNINKSTLHRVRQNLRCENAQKVKDQFRDKVHSALPLTVHWDGKRMKNASKKSGFEERLPVLVTGHNLKEQLLGSPELAQATGKEQANAVANLLNSWGLTDNIQAMCADTTSSNTGRDNGACVFLMKSLGRDLLYIACRHHMFEVVLKGVFEEIVAVSSGPVMTLFKRFRDFWKEIDQTMYEAGINDEMASPFLQEKAADVLGYVTKKLEERHSRDDYRKFLELICIYLGGTPTNGVKFAVPGAVNDARFMSRAIYSLKIMLFRSQFKVSRREEKGLRDFCLFVVTVYVKAWFTAPCAIAASYHDWLFLKSLNDYATVNQKVSEIAVKKFCNHLWYLTHEWTVLALLDDSVPLKTKRKMVASMFDKEAETDCSLFRINVSAKDVPQMLCKDFADFVDSQSVRIFERYGLPSDFLKIDPSQWNDSAAYQVCREYFLDFVVVNDVAERGVALTQEYVGQVKSEEQFQNLLLVSQHTRRLSQNYTKAALSENLFD